MLHPVCHREASSPDDLPSLYFAMYDSYTLDMANQGLLIDVEANLYEVRMSASLPSLAG